MNHITQYTINDKLYLFGGISHDKTTNDVFTIEINTLNVLPVFSSGAIPKPRCLHTQVNVGANLFVFGGKLDNSNEKLDNDIYILDTDAKDMKFVWSKPSMSGSLPDGRYGHTSTLIGTTVYIFGGQDYMNHLNDLISFDIKNFKLQKKKNKFKLSLGKGHNNVLPSWSFIIPNNSPPPPRSGHVSCVYENKIYIFGGSDGDTYYNDTWCYDIQENVWTELSCIGYIPTPREYHGATIVNDVMYIFGGRVKEGYELGDLCAFRISNLRWYKFPNLGPSPSPRFGLTMTLSQDKVYIFGGDSFHTRPDEDGTIHILDTSKIKFPTGTKLAQPNPSEKNPTKPENSIVLPFDASKIKIPTGTQSTKPTVQQTSEENSINPIQQGLSPPPRPMSSQSSDACKEVDRGPVSMISPPTISQPKVITSGIIMSQGPPPPTVLKGKLHEGANIFQSQNYSPTNSEYSSYELQTLQTIGPNEKPLSHMNVWMKSGQDTSFKREHFEIQGVIPEDSTTTTTSNEIYKNTNNQLSNQRMHRRTASQELPVTSAPRMLSRRRISIDNYKKPTAQELPTNYSPRVFPIRRASADNYSRMTDFPSRRTPNENQRLSEFSSKGTLVNNQMSTSPTRELSLRRTSIDDQKPPLITEKSSKRALVNNQRTNSPIKEVTELSSKKTSNNIHRAISPITELTETTETTETTELSSKKTLVDDQEITSSVTETTELSDQINSLITEITELASKRTYVDDQELISPITEVTDTTDLSSRKTLVDDQESISPITEVTDTTDLSSRKTLVDDQESISPITESTDTTDLSSKKTLVDDQETVSPITESKKNLVNDQKSSSPILKSSPPILKSLTNNQTISPTTDSIDDQKAISPITESTDDQSTTSPFTESPTSIDNQNMTLINNTSMISEIIPTIPIITSPKTLLTSRKKELNKTDDNHEEKIKNIRNILNNTRNSCSPTLPAVSTTSIDRNTKRDSLDSIASSDSNQSSNSSLSNRRNGKEIRPRGARPMNGNKPNNGSPLCMSIDSEDIDRNNLLQLRKKLNRTKLSDSSDDLSAPSSPSEIVIYKRSNEDTPVLQHSRSQSSNSSVSDFKLNNDNNDDNNEEEIQPEIDENESASSIYENDDDDVDIISTSPPQSYANIDDENLIQELEQHKSNIEELKQRESWYKAELDSAREIEQMLINEVDDDNIDDVNTDQNRVIEAIIQMRQKLLKAKTSIANQAQIVSEKINTSERARAAAIQEATYFKTKLETLVKLSESKFSNVETNKTKDLENELIKVVSENKLLENQLSELSQSSVELSRAEANEKASERVIAKLAALRLRATTAESQLKESNKQIEKINNELEHYRKEKINDKLQLRNLQSSLSHHQQIFEQVNRSVLESSRRAEDSEKLLKESRDNILKLEKEVMGLRIELESKTRGLNQAVSRVNELEKSLGKVQKEGHVVRNMMQEGMTELLNISWWDKVSNNVWENAKIRKLEEELARLKGLRDDSVIL
ncbi:19010_t:CDS:10 [Rhizophagus irregularis]|nr:19010_t:CDS:10 [Rhizophagus irregularis]